MSINIIGILNQTLLTMLNEQYQYCNAINFNVRQVGFIKKILKSVFLVPTVHKMTDSAKSIEDDGRVHRYCLINLLLLKYCKTLTAIIINVS